MDDLKINISLPPRIKEQVEDQIRQGWFSDLNSLILEALRRYLETHSVELTERWIDQDVDWGLSGNE
jgi:Arc/MetJ-type ribon-helix-helix transcriptional regulator